MHDPLERLYRTKLALLATLLTGVGLGLLVFGHWVQHLPAWHWLSNWPIIDVGSGLFTTGLLGVALQYFDGQDSEVRATQRLERVIRAATPSMRDAVINGFAFQPEDIARVATPEVLDKIATNSLAIRLGDADFAEEIYEDLRQQAISVPERLHDARVSIVLSMDRSTSNGRAPLCIATITWEFRVQPIHATRRFSCVSDPDEFRDLSQDKAANSVWFMRPELGVDAGSQRIFELVEFRVNGEQRPIRRTTKEASQTYSVNLGQEAMSSAEPVTVAYTYRTVVLADHGLLQLRVDQPTKGLSIELDYSACNIDEVTVLDFIASSERTRIERSPKSVPTRSVSVEFDGWALVRSGVAFMWSNRRS